MGVEIEPTPVTSSVPEGSNNKEGYKRSNGNDDTRQQRTNVTLAQGYHYSGEKEDIGVILALQSEKFANKVAFTSFIDKMKNHVLTEFEEARDMIPILDSLEDPTSTVEGKEPTELTEEEAKSEVKRWMKQEKVKQHIKRLNTLESNKEKLYALVWGQFSTGLQEVLKGEDAFVTSDSDFDCIWLLEKAKLVSSGVDTKANKYCSLVQAMTSFCTISQGPNESNDSFRKRIDSAALTLSLAGGDHMLWSPALIKMKMPDQGPSDKEIESDTDTFKAMVMILRADSNRYSSLQKTLFEGVYKGRDEFPVTVTAAYDLLQHFSSDITSYSKPIRGGRFRFRRGRKLANHNSNLTFTQSATKETVPGNDSRVYPHITCRNCNKPGHYANQCPNKSQPVTLAHFSLSQKQLEVIDKNWLLLDTCSTVSVCCNSTLVSDIQNSAPGQGITVITNGGAQSFNQHANLKVLPLKVHYNSDSLANILSLSDVANLPGARLTMDTEIEKAIVLHFNGQQLKFQECSDGIYYWDTQSKSKTTVTNYSDLSFTQTVHSNKQMYSRRDVQGADNARALQAKLGWPSTTKFIQIVDNNLLNNCTVTSEDINRATKIYGPPTPLLQGKMTRSKPQQVSTHTTPIPHKILHTYPTIKLYIDLIYINKLPFLHTQSSPIDFLTIQYAKNRTQGTIKNLLHSVVNKYQSRGFEISDIFGDNEFNVSTLHEFFRPITIHTCAPEEHVPQIERQNRTTKEKLRTICHSLPYKQYTKLMTISLAEYGTYWQNSFPSAKGVSNTLSPSFIVEGRRKPDFNHQHISFGAYALVYIGTKNNLKARSVPAIALRPSNDWGGFYFMSLITGKKLHAFKWMELPINDEVIAQVSKLARAEKQPVMSDGVALIEWGSSNLIRTHGSSSTTLNVDSNHDVDLDEVGENDNVPNQDDNVIHTSDVGDNSDDQYTAENEVNEDNDSTMSFDADIESEMVEAMMTNEEEHDSLVLDENDDSASYEDEEDDVLLTELNDAEDALNEDFWNDDNIEQDDKNISVESEEREYSLLRPSNDIIHSNRATQIENNVSDGQNTVTPVASEVSDNHELDMDVVQGTRPKRTAAGRGIERLEPALGGKEHVSYRMKLGLLQQARQRKTYKNKVMLMMKDIRKNCGGNKQFMQVMADVTFLSAQMSAKKGFKKYGERAVIAMLKECEQLDKGAFPGKPVVEPVHAHDLTEFEKQAAMTIVALIKEKRDGKIKARVCANGSTQKKFLPTDESVASPTLANESLLSTYVIDAYEKRSVVVVDIPGAYLHAGVKHDKHRVLIKLQDEYVDMMCQVNSKYKEFVCYENGRKTLYLKLLRALYGCIESALRWYELFTSTLAEMGFSINPYDRCVANNIIDGKQCTVVWYVDDVKISHVDEAVTRRIVKKLEDKFGTLNPTYGNEQEYLGMKIKIDDEGRVHIDMRDQVCEILDDFSEDISGSATTPAAKHLIEICDNSIPLDKKRSDEFHSTTAKLLYLEKRGRPDIETAVSFLCTRVSEPDEHDWKKLKRVLSFLSRTKDDVRIIGCDNLDVLFTWVDAAYAVHHNMRSHTGGSMSFGWGTIHNKSSKQKLNTKSSTEAEIVGVSDYIPYNIWLVNFLKGQGYELQHNIIYQDNTSAIRMEKNGRNSCTGNSRHIDIRYFFTKDRVDKGEMSIEYCPTHEMLADFYTKPLQGSLFRKMRDVIMGYSHISSLKSKDNQSTSSSMKERIENIDRKIIEDNVNIVSNKENDYKRRNDLGVTPNIESPLNTYSSNEKMTHRKPMTESRKHKVHFEE